MISILIVDDDPRAFQALSQSLKEQRPDWSVQFAESARAAMTILKNSEVNVVLTDTDMPGVAGLELIREVRRKYPRIARIMVSGYSETKEVMKTIGEAHQYLTKPLKPGALIEAVEQSTSHNRFLTNTRLRSAVTHLKNVPSLPIVYSELLAEINKDDPSIREIAEIVKKDIGMTAKILQISNSAFFGFEREVNDPADAVRILGLDTLTSLTLAVGVFSQFQSQKINTGFITQIWNHSTKVAQIAKDITRLEYPDFSNDAFTAGLLHEIGEVVMAANQPGEFALTRNFTPAELEMMLEAERELFGATHAEIGAYLLSLWGIPAAIVDAVAFHHSPSASKAESFTALTAVHVADAFVNAPEFGSESRLEDYCDMDYLISSKNAEKLEEWFEIYVNQSAVPA